MRLPMGGLAQSVSLERTTTRTTAARSGVARSTGGGGRHRRARPRPYPIPPPPNHEVAADATVAPTKDHAASRVTTTTIVLTSHTTTYGTPQPTTPTALSSPRSIPSTLSPTLTAATSLLSHQINGGWRQWGRTVTLRLVVLGLLVQTSRQLRHLDQFHSTPPPSQQRGMDPQTSHYFEWPSFPSLMSWSPARYSSLSSVASASPPPLSPLKILVYMTTHQSASHLDFLTRCWPHASQHLSLLRHADLLYYTSAATDADVPHDVLQQLSFRHVTVQRYVEDYAAPARGPLQRRRKQVGAKRAMVDPFLHHWFDGYDWVIRLNPDVLIRNDTWLWEQMHQPHIQAILYGFDHRGRAQSAFHSDFYAFRPQAIYATGNSSLSSPSSSSSFAPPQWTTAILQQQLDNPHMTAELQMMQLFQHLLVPTATANASDPVDPPLSPIAWLAGVERYQNQARMIGRNSSVLHVHHLVNYCPHYFNASDGQWF